MKARKKPIVIEAVQWTGENASEVKEFIGENKFLFNLEDKEITIRTLEGEMNAIPGDYIIKGVKGEYYPIKADIFKETYEEVKD